MSAGSLQHDAIALVPRPPSPCCAACAGNVSREQLLPLVLKYLATLPASDDPKPRSLSDVTPLQVQWHRERARGMA